MKKLIAILGAIVVVALIAGAGGGSGRNFKANLSGAEEVPPVATDTSGEASFHASQNRDRDQLPFEDHER